MTMPSALITGASRGIGLAIACNLAAQGYGLTITARSQTVLDDLAPMLSALGAPMVCVAAVGLADPSGPVDLVDVHQRSFTALTALILNAGVGTAGPVSEYPTDRLDKTFAVNFRGPFALIQAALPLLRQGAVGRPVQGSNIIVLSSITGVYAEAGLAAYGASKAALLSLVQTVNAEESRTRNHRDSDCACLCRH